MSQHLQYTCFDLFRNKRNVEFLISSVEDNAKYQTCFQLLLKKLQISDTKMYPASPLFFFNFLREIKRINCSLSYHHESNKLGAKPKL